MKENGEDSISGYCTILLELDISGTPVDWTFLHLNPEFAIIVDLPEEKILGHRLSEVFPSADKKALTYAFEAAYGKKSTAFDVISREKDVYRHVEFYPSEREGTCACVIHDRDESIARRERKEAELEALVCSYEKERKLSLSVRRLVSALGIVYPLVISIDYTNNHYEMLEYDNFVNRTCLDSGTVEELVKTGASTIPDKKAGEKFIALFSRENAIRAFRKGQKELSLRHLQNGDDGLVHYMDTHVICTSHSDKKVEAICVARCIDEEAERDRAREKEAEHAAVITALSTIYTTIIDVDLTCNGYSIIQTSSPMEKVMGGRREGDFTLVCEDVLEYFIHPDDRERMRGFVDLSTLSRRIGSGTTVETEYRAPYGRWFEARFIEKKRDDEGRVTKAIYCAKDVTAEKLRELNFRSELQEQLAISSTLARNFRNVYLVDLESEKAKILKLEAGYDEIEKVGIGKEFPFSLLLSNWLGRVVHPDDRKEVQSVFDVENVRRMLRERTEFTGNYRTTANGELHYFQYSMSRTDESGKKAILGFQIVDDIVRAQTEEEEKRTELEKAYREKLETAAEEAEKANRTKTDFLLRMSHDIRTPLNGIRGMLDIADYYDGDSDKQRECRHKIRESSNILLELINEVLDMSKLESGEVVLESVPFDLEHISFEIFTVVEKQAQELGITITEDSSVKHTRLIGSPVHFKRLLLNILGNAIKYNKVHGSVNLTCREVSFDGSSVMIETVISDTGIGMSEEFQKHLFEPFQQENAAARTKYGGTGLGLSIAKNLTQKMGGTIECRSVKDIGTTFTLLIPFKVDTENRVDEEEKENRTFSIKGEKLILAEDNDLNLEIAEFILKEAGAVVVTAHDGEEAVRAFEESAPGEISAVLMDLMMPVMDGYEATRNIRAMERMDASSVPIIAMTANAFVEDRIATKKAGMNAHITKPLNAQNLIRVVQECIKASRKNEEK